MDEDYTYDRYRNNNEYSGRSSSTRITPLGGIGSAKLGNGCNVGGRTASTTAGQGRRLSDT